MGDATSLEVHPEVDGLTLFHAPPGPHEHAVHAHDAYSVIVLYEGQKEFRHQGKTVIVTANQIAIANPGELHGCGPVDGQPWAHKTWYLSQELMSELSADLGLSAEPRLQSPRIDDARLADQLIAAHDRSRTGELLDRQTAALEALTSLVSRFGTGPGEQAARADLSDQARDRMPTYEDLMKSKLDERVDLQTLGEAAHVGRIQVIRDFRAIHGVTPGQYFRQLRLNHAKRLMAQGADLSGVSQMTGFADQSHFTRMFRRAFGVTPGDYRRLIESTRNAAPF